MFCSNCGKEIIDSDKFCIHCGEKLIFENNVEDKSNELIKNDIQTKYLLFFFVAYLIITIMNNKFNDIAYSIGYSLGMFIWAFPIIGMVYLIQKIRKKTYLRPKLHLAIISFLFFLISLMDK